MRLDRIFLALNLLLVLVSVAAHEVAAESYAFLALTVILCAVVWRKHAVGRPVALNESIGTLVCAVAFGIMMYVGFSPGALGDLRLLDVRVPVVGEFLIVFQWVYLCREKRVRDYFWMYLVTIVHMGTAGLLMPTVAYGFFFVLYALAGVCALAVYHIWAEVAAADPDAVKETRIRLGFVAGALPLTILLMVPVAAIFALLPRKAAETTLAPQLVRLGTQPVAGFSSTVLLGAVGTIQENPQAVMHVSVRDPKTGQPRQAAELLLRGVALDQYVHAEEQWRWESTAPYSWTLIRPGPGGGELNIYGYNFPQFPTTPNYDTLLCNITLNPLQSRYLFVPFAAQRVSLSRTFQIYGNTETHDIAANRSWRTPLEYTVASRVFHPTPGAGPAGVSERRLRQFLALPNDLSPRVKALARRVIPQPDKATDYEKARRILEYLSDAARFSYTTRMDPTPGVEPVEDFLFNRPRGHCEYFASAMVIMLRTVNVPARLVNGFKAVEWNPMTNQYVIRQSNAHSWVEAYLRPEGWRTFDPSVQREAATPRPVIVKRWWRTAYDTAETLWVQHVLNYDPEAQSELYNKFAQGVLFLQKLWLTAVMLAGMEPLGMSKWQLQSLLNQFTEPVRIALLAAAIFIAIMAASYLALGVSRWLRGRRRVSGAVRYYDRMERQLAKRGIFRKAWQTPWEFHDAVAGKGWPEMPAVRTITSAFCRARYGGHEPSSEELLEIDSALRQIRAAKYSAAGRN